MSDYKVEITSPNLILADKNGVPLPNITGSRTQVEAMEKASGLPPGTYKLVSPDSTIKITHPDVVSPPVDPTVDFEIGSVVQDGVTPEQIALYAEVSGELSQNTTANVEYRLVGALEWLESAPLWRIQPAYSGTQTPKPVVDAFAGTIFGLDVGSDYEVKVIFDDGDAEEVRTGTYRTRALAVDRGPATVFVSTENELKEAVNSAVPGDVIQMTQNIELTGSVDFWRSGSADNLCYLCGMGRDKTTLSTTVSNRILYLTANSHWVFEDFTIQGLGTNADLGVQSQAAQFYDGAGGGQTGNTFRRLRITGVDAGILASNPINGTTIYDCIVEGNNEWTRENVDSNLTWNDDGIRLPGVGNVAFNNDITGFGDSCALMAGVFSSAVYFYRNKIRNSCDDAIEAEYGTRNYAFYDNQVTNCGNALSVDGVHGGPFYYFRNRVANIARYPYKCGAVASGVLIWSNTLVATEGVMRSPAGFWYWSVSANMRSWEYRNNILIFDGQLAKMLRFDWGAQNWTPWKCDHNGWGRNGQVMDYTNVANATGDLATVHAAIAPIHDYDIELSGQDSVFSYPVVFGSDYADQIVSNPTLELSATSEAIAAGVVIPGITNSGDLGAVGYGEVLPVIGNRFEPEAPPVDLPIDPPAFDGLLASLASTLSPGQSAPFPEGNLGALSAAWNRSDFTWQSHFHYDPTRREVSVLGMAHGDYMKHARYSMASDVWTQVPVLDGKVSGHIYGHSTDDGEGNIFFYVYNRQDMIGYVRDIDTWVRPIAKTPFTAQILLGGHAFHPNIGTQGGDILFDQYGMWLWDLGTDTWERLRDKPFEDFYGQGMYVPGWNATILGGDKLYRVEADKSVIELGEPPHKVNAGSLAYQDIASIHVHPSDDSTVLILEHDGTAGGTLGRWWSSTDGTNWTLRGSGHPLKGLGQSGWTGCTIPDLGIIWGIGGDDPNAANSSVIWKVPTF